MASFNSDSMQGYYTWGNGYATEKKPAHDEVKTTCENCQEGVASFDNWDYSSGFAGTQSVKCPCCNGDWQSRQNCTEGTGNHNADDVRADMRGHL